jgi:hypothetical protein
VEDYGNAVLVHSKTGYVVKPCSLQLRYQITGRRSLSTGGFDSLTEVETVKDNLRRGFRSVFNAKLKVT